jgi:hypothetical protein
MAKASLKNLSNRGERIFDSLYVKLTTQDKVFPTTLPGDEEILWVRTPSGMLRRAVS